MGTWHLELFCSSITQHIYRTSSIYKTNNSYLRKIWLLPWSDLDFLYVTCTLNPSNSCNFHLFYAANIFMYNYEKISQPLLLKNHKTSSEPHKSNSFTWDLKYICLFYAHHLTNIIIFNFWQLSWTFNQNKTNQKTNSKQWETLIS